MRRVRADYGGRPVASFLVREILKYLTQRIAADVGWAGEGIIDLHDRKNRGESQDRQEAGHQELRAQVLSAEKECERNSENSRSKNDEPYDRRDDTTCKMDARPAGVRDFVELLEHLNQKGRLSRIAFR